MCPTISSNMYYKQYCLYKKKLPCTPLKDKKGTSKHSIIFLKTDVNHLKDPPPITQPHIQFFTK